MRSLSIKNHTILKKEKAIRMAYIGTMQVEKSVAEDPIPLWQRSVRYLYDYILAINLYLAVTNIAISLPLPFTTVKLHNNRLTASFYITLSITWFPQFIPAISFSPFITTTTKVPIAIEIIQARTGPEPYALLLPSFQTGCIVWPVTSLEQFQLVISPNVLLRCFRWWYHRGMYHVFHPRWEIPRRRKEVRRCELYIIP